MAENNNQLTRPIQRKSRKRRAGNMTEQQNEIINELYITFQHYMSRQEIIDVIRNIGVAGNDVYYEQCYQHAAMVEYNQRTTIAQQYGEEIDGQRAAIAEYNQTHQQQINDNKKKEREQKIKILVIIIVLLIAVTIPPVIYFFGNTTTEYIKYTRALRGYNYVINIDTTSDVLQKFVVKILGRFQESESVQSSDEFNLDQTGFGVDVYQMQELDIDGCKDKLTNVIKAYNVNSETQKDIFQALSSPQFQKTNYDVNVKSHHIDVYYIRLFVGKMHENKYSLYYGAIHWAYSTNEEYLTPKQMYLLREKVESEAVREFTKGLAEPVLDDFFIAL